MEKDISKIFSQHIVGMPESKSYKIERIVVRGTNWVGDAVMTVPALRNLRRLFPDSQITLATGPGSLKNWLRHRWPSETAYASAGFARVAKFTT
jgi:hypothetical protein